MLHYFVCSCTRDKLARNIAWLVLIRTLVETVLVWRVFFQHFVQFQYIRRRLGPEVVICTVKAHDDTVGHGLTWVRLENHTVTRFVLLLRYVALPHWFIGWMTLLFKRGHASATKFPDSKKKDILCIPHPTRRRRPYHLEQPFRCLSPSVTLDGDTARAVPPTPLLD